MPKNKLLRYAELATFKNVLQPGLDEIKNGFHLKGKWGAEYFKNDNPIVLELGCGKGEYTICLAEKYPDKNFIGIDIKGARIWKGGKIALENNMKNVAFIRTFIDKIECFFGKDEISEIWLTFPDPQKRERRTKKRLTSPGFLSRYEAIIQKGGIIHLKTDNVPFFDYTLKMIQENNNKLIWATHDLYGSGKDTDILSIRTFYEQKYLAEGLPICYMRFTLGSASALLQ